MATGVDDIAPFSHFPGYGKAEEIKPVPVPLLGDPDAMNIYPFGFLICRSTREPAGNHIYLMSQFDQSLSQVLQYNLYTAQVRRIVFVDKQDFHNSGSSDNTFSTVWKSKLLSKASTFFSAELMP